jgi:TonB family protein
MLTLPHVQVRLTSAPLPGAVPGPKAAAASAPARPAAEPGPAKQKGRKAEESPPKHPIPDKRAPQRAEALARTAPPSTGAQAPGDRAGPTGPLGGSSVTSVSGGLALGATGGDEAFPFTYYLNRALALIEGNWFRPPAPIGTVCRVRCVIDRTGRLVEAGLEAESQTPAFDRAALRAVYASAPLPPLPQGFGGSTLTLHLEFGQ